jgi:hypothetical protein
MLAGLVAVLRRQYIGVLALFLVLGGTAYAAAQIPPNSVGSAEIKRRAVKTQDIAFNAVTASRLAPDCRQQRRHRGRVDHGGRHQSAQLPAKRAGPARRNRPTRSARAPRRNGP